VLERRGSNNHFVLILVVVVVGRSHHAEGLPNPKVRAKKSFLILDKPEPVDSENIKLKIGSRPLSWNTLEQFFNDFNKKMRFFKKNEKFYF
jgi:hypothetical protein